MEQGPISAGERAWSQWLALRGHSLEAQARARLRWRPTPYKRGMALEAGWRREAEEELVELLEVLGNDPTAVEHVAFQVRQRGFYPTPSPWGSASGDRLRYRRDLAPGRPQGGAEAALPGLLRPGGPRRARTGSTPCSWG